MLLDYLPKYMAAVEDIKKAENALQPEFNDFNNNISDVQNELFVETAGEYGVERLEKLYGIASNGSQAMELRKFRILTKINGSANSSLRDMLNNILDEDSYRISFDLSNMYLEVRITVENREYLEIVKNMLDKALPCNIVLDVGILYASHQMISAYTHGFLADYSNENVKLIGISL